MNTARNQALIALTAAGLLWGTSVPLSKAALGGFGPAWLTVVRFAVAAVVLLAVLRPRMRGNVRPALVLWGALGYGGCILVQNIGLGMTSVTHAALLIGAVPVIVAALAVVFDGARVSLIAWAGFVLSLAGIAVVAGAGGGDASLAGDGLVLLSVLVGSAFTILQARLLAGQDVIAASAAQFLASAVVILPIAVLTEGLPTVHGFDGAGWSGSTLLAAAGLATIGTVFPYTLFAFGQTGVAPQIAGAFLNLETLVAALLGATLFGEPTSIGQGIGALALLGGIYLSTGPSSAAAEKPALVGELAVARELATARELERAGEPAFAHSSPELRYAA
jgi:drug/metabolite transporter (DMT)-like permease